MPVALLLSSGDPNVTELFVCHGIDPPLVGTTDVRAFAVDDDGAIVVDTVLSIGSSGENASQAFVQRRTDRLLLVLEGTYRDATFRQSIDVPFVENAISDVTLRLEADCAARMCPSGSTCVEGTCVEIEVNERCVTEHGVAPRPECTDPRLASVCSAPVLDE